MKPRAWRDPLVASHALFLGNVLLWMPASLPCAGLLLFTTIASTCYHRSGETDRWWGPVPPKSGWLFTTVSVDDPPQAASVTVSTAVVHRLKRWKWMRFIFRNSWGHLAMIRAIVNSIVRTE